MRGVNNGGKKDFGCAGQQRRVGSFAARRARRFKHSGTMAQAPYVQFIAPALWRYEIANALNMAMRRGRIQPSDLLWIYAEIKNLFIKVQDDAQDPEILIAVAQKSGLTAYDAAYLELTLRLNARLATNDKQLRAAALTAGLVVL